MKTITGKSRTILQIYFELTRSTLSSAIALSAAVGFISFHHGIDAAPLPIYLGVYLLACAASALNQYQESKNDSVMERTKNRPLADHKIKQFSALIIIILNLIAGLLIIQLFFNLKTTLVACFNLIWYNAVYTPLKRKTHFAVLIGALTGAIPPAIGWIAAGGDCFNRVIISIGFYFFMWQVPHFLSLFLKYSSDYHKAGFPMLFNTSIKQSYRVILLTWLTGTALSSMLLILSGAVSGLVLSLILCTGNIFFLSYCFFILFLKNEKADNKFTYSFYVYQAFVLLLLILSVF